MGLLESISTIWHSPEWARIFTRKPRRGLRRSVAQNQQEMKNLSTAIAAFLLAGTINAQPDQDFKFSTKDFTAINIGVDTLEAHAHRVFEKTGHVLKMSSASAPGESMAYQVAFLGVDTRSGAAQLVYSIADGSGDLVFIDPKNRSVIFKAEGAVVFYR